MKIILAISFFVSAVAAFSTKVRTRHIMIGIVGYVGMFFEGSVIFYDFAQKNCNSPTIFVTSYSRNARVAIPSFSFCFYGNLNLSFKIRGAVFRFGFLKNRF
jgi:hypothetical protein